MKRALFAAAVLSALTLSVPAKADSISAVEGARAHERAGSPLTWQEREKLRRYGSNDDGFYSGRRGYGYRSGPSVGIYVGPGYGGYGYSSPGYYGPYGY
ncbi:MAG: hypothetical protein C0519_00245 [Hyphomicrobium sp.]|nr:hypothetical protein [Hyphomicrobium sp.]PPD08140.1 MAG: hypothetical protein CTY28_07315 [Hyphomicrobium sp.]